MALNNRKVVMFATHALLPNNLDGLNQPAIALSSPRVANTINQMIDSGIYKDKNTNKTLFSYAHPMFWAAFTLVGNGPGGSINDKDSRL